MPLLEEDDLVVTQLAVEADRVCGLSRDAGDLIPRLLDRCRSVDAEHLALDILQREAGNHPRLRRAGDRAHDDRVEEDVAELGFLLCDLLRPPREAESAERMIRGARRNRVGLPAAFLD